MARKGRNVAPERVSRSSDRTTWALRAPWPGFLADMPVIARPIFVSMLACALWFFVLSPLAMQGLGEAYRPTAVDHGRASIGECRRNWLAPVPTWICAAEVQWTTYAPDHSEVLSRSDISHQVVDVERRLVRRSGGIERFRAGGSRVMTPDFPISGFTRVLTTTVVNGVAVFAIFWVAFWFGRRGVFGLESDER